MNEEEQGGEETADRPRDRRSASIDDLVTRDLVANAGRSGTKLKELLNGTILVNFIDSGKKYLIDWTDTGLRSQPATAGATADCTILLSEDHFKRIAAGDLNPQIAMLSEKVRIEGRKAAAMYFFNLVAPQSGM